MSQTKTIGFRVQTSTGLFVSQYGTEGAVQDPCSQAEAYRRVGEYLTRYPTSSVPSVVPVTREATPMERTASELGSMLTSLCRRNGLDLGLTPDQIERQIAKELAELAARR